ncbi:MAG: ABC transporter substrate-binding protein [Methylohalobius sp.]|nr:ABC transporter substrate-binding protein [Methylohalobius sp.]
MQALTWIVALFLPLSAWSATPRVLTVGALAYGTLNWELTVIERERLARSFRLSVRKLANPQAAEIALQAGAVDLIVADWLWVARQRNRGVDFTAVPYSLTHGALIVPPDSPIRSLQDLVGKRIGIAGGGLDKNWLLLQALTRQRHGLELSHAATPVFAAPPLLNQQLLQGRLDALLTYWHYAAPLEAKGYQTLMTGEDLLKELGIGSPLPTLGYVFRESLAQRFPEIVQAFLEAAFQARQAICSQSEVWRYVAPLTEQNDPKVQAVLRERYCEGRINRWGEEELKAAARLYRLLASLSGESLTGAATDLPAGTFWQGFTLPR